MMNSENLEIQIKTYFGLEEVLAQEVKKLGGRNVQIKNRAVNCVGDLGFLYKVNYAARTAVRVLVPIYEFEAINEFKFYDRLSKFEWDEFLDVNQSFAINATVHSERFKHSQFISLKMKDAMVDYFRRKYEKRPNVDIKSPDISFHLHIDQDQITVSLDSSGESLHKRGYRKESGEAPISEVLAAGMLQIAGWDGKGNFLDPMCGSGTILIEAAMIAADLPAQIFRREFAFQNWKNYDSELFSTIREHRINRIKPVDGKIIGFDTDSKMISAAIKNVESAELEDTIEISRQDFFESKKEHFPLLMVFNPPYNERIQIADDDFYKKIGDTFKQNYPNTFAWLITADMEAAKKIGLRPSRRIKLFNGKLETRFLQYEMYEGSKKSGTPKREDHPSENE